MSDTAAELRAVLLHVREVTDELLARLGEPEVQEADVVNLLESLAVAEQRRAPLADEFRGRVSTQRRREEERSIRQFVLRALDEIGVPQTAGFLEEYLYARDLVVLKTRGMGALRRDEYRAWDRLRRSSRPRMAYVVPCLDELGSPVPRWMGRSDWPLRERLVVEGAEELWAAHRTLALIDGFRHADGDAEAPFFPLIERHAAESLGHDIESGEIGSAASLERLRAEATKRIATLEKSVAKTRDKVAARFETWDEQAQLWGRANQ